MDHICANRLFIKTQLFDNSDEIEIKLPLYKSSSTFRNISGGLYTQVVYSLVGDNLKPNVTLKSSKGPKIKQLTYSLDF